MRSGCVSAECSCMSSEIILPLPFTHIAYIQAASPDLCITAAYGQFLPSAFLSIPRYGTLNIHPSLLPKYRGASPVQRTLQSGDAETGVTVLFTVLKMDAGPIVRQVKHPLQGDEKVSSKP